MADPIINLNVGGVIYTTTHSTLTKYPDSMLSKMFTGLLPSAQDSNGNYFIDRDGKLFRYILIFLRSSQLLLPDDFQELDLLAAEADFFQILPLIDALKPLCDEKLRKSQVPTFANQQVIGLNVSGTLYTVFKKDLESDLIEEGKDEHLLTVRHTIVEIVSKPDAIRDGAGNYILQGDPLLFRFILNFIQTGYFHVPNDFAEHHQLLLDLSQYDPDIFLPHVLPEYIMKLCSSDVAKSLDSLQYTLFGGPLR